MKVLLAYDGSHGADAALDDLGRAGLPEDVEMMVLTVADASMALASRAFAMAATGIPGARPDHRAEQAAAAVEHAREVAREAVERLRTRFRSWHVSPDVWGGSSGSSIALKADLWQPDLVVLGSRSRAHPGRLFLGSVARKVLTETRCSVRVGRASVGAPGTPVRIVVGHDGGGGGKAALLAAAARSWPAGSQIRAVAVQEAEVWSVFGPEFGSEATWPPSDMPTDRTVLRKILEQDVDRARRDGVEASVEMASGTATGALLRIARKWKADCVFVGATSRGKDARFLLGSVSAAVADRARCSVEVVRARSG